MTNAAVVADMITIMREHGHHHHDDECGCGCGHDHDHEEHEHHHHDIPKAHGKRVYILENLGLCQLRCQDGIQDQ